MRFNVWCRHTFFDVGHLQLLVSEISFFPVIIAKPQVVVCAFLFLITGLFHLHSEETFTPPCVLVCWLLSFSVICENFHSTLCARLLVAVFLFHLRQLSFHFVCAFFFWLQVFLPSS